MKIYNQIFITGKLLTKPGQPKRTEPSNSPIDKTSNLGNLQGENQSTETIICPDEYIDFKVKTSLKVEAQGSEKTRYQYFNVRLFGAQEVLKVKNLEPGALLFVEGRLDLIKIEYKNGTVEQVPVLQVYADKLAVLAVTTDYNSTVLTSDDDEVMAEAYMKLRDDNDTQVSKVRPPFP